MPRVDDGPAPAEPGQPTAAPGGLSPFRAHVAKWTGCQLCPLGGTRLKMCFARGRLPADVLLCGEAPGESENVLGQPFVGPAGHLLDRIMARALAPFPGVRWVVTNLVCCIPRDPEKGGKLAVPLPEEVRACAPRLLEFIDLARPRLLVAVGAEARDWLDEKRGHNVWFGGKAPRLKDRAAALHPSHKIPRIDVIHPAAVLRMPLVGQTFTAQKAAVQIMTAVRTYVKGGSDAARP